MYSSSYDMRAHPLYTELVGKLADIDTDRMSHLELIKAASYVAGSIVSFMDHLEYADQCMELVDEDPSLTELYDFYVALHHMYDVIYTYVNHVDNDSVRYAFIACQPMYYIANQ